MFDYDHHNFIKFLNDFPAQLKEAQEIYESSSVDIDFARVKQIVFAGMGGSAISGDLVSAYLADRLTVPAIIHRGYDLPEFVNAETLVIGSSYSGNTEETISSIQQGLAKGAQVLAISSNGEVEKLANENGFTLIKIPGGLPPRQALGYLFVPLLLLLTDSPLTTGEKEDLGEVFKLIAELQKRFDPKQSQGNNLAHHIAQTLYHTIPVIYTAVPYLYPVPVRWRNQFNENSKIMAFSNVFPELNHNEIMGWEGPPEVNRLFRVIILRDPGESERNRQRVEITKTIIKDKGIPVLEIFAEGKSKLARMFSLIYTGDWASYYLAMINEKDPIRIDSIDLLKKKLSELKQS